MNPFDFESESIYSYNAQPIRRKRMTSKIKTTKKQNTKTDSQLSSVKFTLASSKDKFPTVTASRLGLLASKSTTKILVSIASKSLTSGTPHLVEFRLNRFVSNTNATFVATSWPKGLRKPKIGQPRELTVLSIKTA